MNETFSPVFSSFSPLVPYLRYMLPKMTAHGTGHEYGVSINEIIAEFMTMRSIGLNAEYQEISKALNYQLNGIPIFEKFQKPDGSVYYKLSSSADSIFRYFEQQQGQTNFLDYSSAFSHEKSPYYATDSQFPHFLRDQDLKQEIARLKDKKKQLQQKNEYLKSSINLLQNPVALDEMVTKLDTYLSSLRDTYTMIDEKVNTLLEFINAELRE